MRRILLGLVLALACAPKQKTDSTEPAAARAAAGVDGRRLMVVVVDATGVVLGGVVTAQLGLVHGSQQLV